MTTTIQLDSIQAAVRRNLRAWYRRSARDLPWRKTREPYRIWVSEIMLQQTRVETVIPYYERFLATFPTIRALADADEEKLLKIWQGLGYYSRARNLQKAARIVVGQLAGRVPHSVDELRRLPGVGRYTAGAIASIGFDQRAPVLDGNVKRVLARLLAVRENVDATETKNEFWSLAGRLVPPQEPGRFNQALMELGATVCTPTGPACLICPVRNQCAAAAAGIQHELPVRSAKKPVPHHHIVVAAVRKNGRYLLVKRAPDGLLGGLWEFPGGRLNGRKNHRDALVDRVHQRVNLDIEIGEHIAAVDHAYSHFKITLHAYQARYVGGRVRTSYHQAARWVPPAQFDRYAFPAAMVRVLAQMEKQ